MVAPVEGAPPTAVARPDSNGSASSAPAPRPSPTRTSTLGPLELPPKRRPSAAVLITLAALVGVAAIAIGTTALVSSLDSDESSRSRRADDDGVRSRGGDLAPREAEHEADADRELRWPDHPRPRSERPRGLDPRRPRGCARLERPTRRGSSSQMRRRLPRPRCSTARRRWCLCPCRSSPERWSPSRSSRRAARPLPPRRRRSSRSRRRRTRITMRPVPPERAARHAASSSVAPICVIWVLPASSHRTRASRPGDERHCDSSS